MHRASIHAPVIGTALVRELITAIDPHLAQLPDSVP